MRRFSTSQNCLHKSINFYKLSDSLNVCDFAINLIYLQFIYVQYVTAQSQTKRCPVQRWVDFKAKVSFNTVDLRPTSFLHKHFITPALSQWFNLLDSKIQCIQYNCTIHIDTYWTKIIVLSTVDLEKNLSSCKTVIYFLLTLMEQRKWMRRSIFIKYFSYTIFRP